MVCYAMAKTLFSGKTMRNYHKAILTIPGDELKELVLKCGMSTGRKTDKVKEFNVEMESVEDSEIKVPVHSKVAILLSLLKFKEVGDHYLYICKVDSVFETENEKALFAFNGYSKIDVIK